jgi:sugar lactone lactonase YvrE
MRHPLPTLTLIGLFAVTACSSDGSDTTADPVETTTPTTVADTTADETVPEETTPATDAPTTTETPPEPVALLAAGAEIGAANGLFFDAQDRLWVASVNSGIFVIDPDSGETLEHYPGNVASADDVTVAADGTVYFTDIINGQVGIIDPDGTLRDERLAVGPGANSITFSDDGRLFVGADFLGDGLFEVDTTGATPPRVVTPDPGWLNGMDFGPDGFIYAPRWTEGTIVRADPETGELTTIADNSESVYAAVKFDPDGVLHAVEALPAHVVEVDINTGEQTILATMEGTNDNLAFDSTGRLFVSSSQNGSIHEILDDGSVRVVKEPALAASAGIVVEEVDGVEEVSVLTIQALVTLDGETGEELGRLGSTADAGFALEHPALGGALRSDDDGLLVLDWTPGAGVEVWDVDGNAVTATYPVDFGYDVIRFGSELYSSLSLTSNVSRLSATGAEVVFEVNAPTGLAATETELYVASLADGTILRLAAGGALLDAPVVVAEGLDAPEGLAVLADGTLVVVETGSGDVTRIDIATGETTVLAEGISPAYTLADFYPAYTPSSVAVAPSGNIYVTSPADGNVWRILAS